METGICLFELLFGASLCARSHGDRLRGRLFKLFGRLGRIWQCPRNISQDREGTWRRSLSPLERVDEYLCGLRLGTDLYEYVVCL